MRGLGRLSRQVYFRDFLHRCRQYGLTSHETAEAKEDEGTGDDASTKTRNSGKESTENLLAACRLVVGLIAMSLALFLFHGPHCYFFYRISILSALFIFRWHCCYSIVRIVTSLGLTLFCWPYSYSSAFPAREKFSRYFGQLAHFRCLA